jgi:DNA recombination-dependent growth factor C
MSRTEEKKTPEGLHKCFTSHRIKDIKLSTLHDKKNVFKLRKNKILEDCADQVKTKRFTSDEKKTYTTIDTDVGSIRQDCASQVETERVASDEKKKHIQLYRHCTRRKIYSDSEARKYVTIVQTKSRQSGSRAVRKRYTYNYRH